MHLRTALALSLAALLGLASTATTRAEDKPAVKVKVFVQLQETPGGFVNPEFQDALKDVRQSVQKKKDWLELVEGRQQADMVVTVVNRMIEPSGTYESTSNASTNKQGTYATGTARTREIQNYVVQAVLQVGDYQQQVKGSCLDTYILGGLWRTAAGDVVNQVEKFAKTNYNKLMADRAIQRR